MQQDCLQIAVTLSLNLEYKYEHEPTHEVAGSEEPKDKNLHCSTLFLLLYYLL